MNYDYRIDRGMMLRDKPENMKEAFDYEIARAVAGDGAEQLLYEISAGDMPTLSKGDAAIFMAGYELGRRNGTKRRTIVSPQDAYAEFRRFWNPEQEVFSVISLNGAHEVVDSFIVSVGLIDKTIIHPRECFSRAIQNRACAIMVAHNHPSHNLEPTDNDVKATRRLSECGKLLGINVLDSFVYDDRNYYSMLENGRM